MRFLLDTNLVSEAASERVNPGVKAWISGIDPGDAYLSVITLLEVRYGVSILAVGRRRSQLEHWLDEVLPLEWGANILPIDLHIANFAGELIAACRRAGRPAETNDALIAATAQIHQLVVVTRNVGDFEIWGGAVLNPWT